MDYEQEDEHQDPPEIRGEYWIIDGSVEFADGDVGDYNHEGIAMESIASNFADEVGNLADDLGIDTETYSNAYNGPTFEDVSNMLQAIYDHLEELDTPNIENYIMERIGADQNAWTVLYGGHGAAEYMMTYMGWIAVRSMNIELYGYDETKRRSLARGIDEIIEQDIGHEQHKSEAISSMEFSLHDHKTNTSTYITYADIENQQPVMRPQLPNINKGDRRFTVTTPDSEENKYAQQVPPKPISPWKTGMQQNKIIGQGQDLWRGTSECSSFKSWMRKFV